MHQLLHPKMPIGFLCFFFPNSKTKTRNVPPKWQEKEEDIGPMESHSAQKAVLWIQEPTSSGRASVEKQGDVGNSTPWVGLAGKNVSKNIPKTVVFRS